MIIAVFAILAIALLAVPWMWGYPSRGVPYPYFERRRRAREADARAIEQETGYRARADWGWWADALWLAWLGLLIFFAVWLLA
ncbi:MAG: hypothetical protein R3B59_01000 [Dehalococcoidia bacterium]